MKMETGFQPAALAPSVARNRAAWLAAGAVVVAILAIYWRTAAEMVAIWTRSETFAHGYVVLPVSLWLIWRKRDELRGIEARPWPPALLGVGAAGFLWLLADLASVAGPAQLALVLMVQSAVVAVLGLTVARAILFPLAFLLFAVPAGEFLVPRLIDTTADFTVLAIQATGIPVYREGNDFVIPSGNWSVVEACSGIRYLIASVMGGALYAYLTYRSFWRRAAFMAVAVVVPIFANWFRAYLIVMIGHLTGNRLAVGVDHLVYGWIFFGVVIGIMFWIGSLWREDTATPARGGNRFLAPGALAPPGRRGVFAAAAATTLLAAIWLPAAARIEAAGNTAPPAALTVVPENGWRAVPVPPGAWAPEFHGQRAEYHGRFEKDGREVGVYVAYYRDQAQGRELVNSENVLVRSSDRIWKRAGSGTGALDWAGGSVEARRVELVAGERRLAVAQVYWIGGDYTASDVVAKIRLALQKLALRDDDSAAIVIHAERPGVAKGGEDPLPQFAREMSGAIDRGLARASGQGD